MNLNPCILMLNVCNYKIDIIYTVSYNTLIYSDKVGSSYISRDIVDFDDSNPSRAVVIKHSAVY